MDIQRIKELALANGFKLKEQVSGNMDLNAYVYDFANAIEREVKAQAVPEGFVLVPKKATKKMLDAGYEAHDGFFSNGAVQDVYVAMIEAQEPAND